MAWVMPWAVATARPTSHINAHAGRFVLRIWDALGAPAAWSTFSGSTTLKRGHIGSFAERFIGTSLLLPPTSRRKAFPALDIESPPLTMLIS